MTSAETARAIERLLLAHQTSFDAVEGAAARALCLTERLMRDARAFLASEGLEALLEAATRSASIAWGVGTRHRLVLMRDLALEQAGLLGGDDHDDDDDHHHDDEEEE